MSEQTAAPQRYFTKFPTRLNRESISRTRESRGLDQGIYVGVQSVESARHCFNTLASIVPIHMDVAFIFLNIRFSTEAVIRGRKALAYNPEPKDLYAFLIIQRSGACILGMLHTLDGLVKRADRRSMA